MQTILTGANLTPLGTMRTSNPVITFDDQDLTHGQPGHNEPMKLKLPSSHLIECLGSLYGFAGEQVSIMGTIELETTLNRLGTVISTYHLCMKYPIGRRVGSIWVDSWVARRCYEDSLRIRSCPSGTT
ncbi:hypothetical protein CR513_54244, partial [Mucuna pruriens]